MVREKLSLFYSGWTPSQIALALLPALLIAQRFFRRLERYHKVPRLGERVLVLGATGGIGQAIAHLYSRRGARVCVIGRRAEKIKEVLAECRALHPGPEKDSGGLLGIEGDFADIDAMVRVRTTLVKEWQGLDTLVVVAGVSALQPLMAIAGLVMQEGGFEPAEATENGIRKVLHSAELATRGNLNGPLISAVTLIPLLKTTSKSPSILLVSSMAALIPPPTRTLYASTKAASLTLYQALAIEHPSISFSFVFPSTVEGDFRASAVDSGPIREADPNKHGLKRQNVAERCITAIDRYERNVFMPSWMRIAQLLYWVWPSFIEWRAKKKYNFSN
ncbi:hypothetical protein BD779DRAFT_1626118 [Infundibulicybe gibba]|nr:hypothetical protein BD779DRAFT_1626118 [Infundibulicybe gibba]